MQLTLESWVPKAARERIEKLWTAPWLTDAGRAKLHRLATYPLMKTDVWGRLPKEPADQEGDIIEWTVRAPRLFWLKHRKRPKKKAQLIDHLIRKPPITTPDFVMWAACILRDSMWSLRADTGELWHDHWKGDPNIDPDKALEFIQHVIDFYATYWEIQDQCLADLPSVINSNSPKSEQQFTTMLLDTKLHQLYGRRCEKVAAALANVAFDLGRTEEIDEGRVRKQRKLKGATKQNAGNSGPKLDQ